MTADGRETPASAPPKQMSVEDAAVFAGDWMEHISVQMTEDASVGITPGLDILAQARQDRLQCLATLRVAALSRPAATATLEPLSDRVTKLQVFADAPFVHDAPFVRCPDDAVAMNDGGDVLGVYSWWLNTFTDVGVVPAPTASAPPTAEIATAAMKQLGTPDNLINRTFFESIIHAARSHLERPTPPAATAPPSPTPADVGSSVGVPAPEVAAGGEEMKTAWHHQWCDSKQMSFDDTPLLCNCAQAPVASLVLAALDGLDDDEILCNGAGDGHYVFASPSSPKTHLTAGLLRATLAAQAPPEAATAPTSFAGECERSMSGLHTWDGGQCLACGTRARRRAVPPAAPTSEP